MAASVLEMGGLVVGCHLVFDGEIIPREGGGWLEEDTMGLRSSRRSTLDEVVVPTAESI